MWDTTLLIVTAVAIHTATAMKSEQQEFKFFNDAKTWQEAETACQDEDMHLASIHSQAQMNDITKYAYASLFHVQVC